MGIEEICSIVWTFFLEHKIIAGFIIMMISGAIESEKEDRTRVRNMHDKLQMSRERDSKKINDTKIKSIIELYKPMRNQPNIMLLQCSVLFGCLSASINGPLR